MYVIVVYSVIYLRLSSTGNNHLQIIAFSLLSSWLMHGLVMHWPVIFQLLLWTCCVESMQWPPPGIQKCLVWS